MNTPQHSDKLAELRARTDRDLLAVLTREIDSIRALRDRHPSAAWMRLERARILLAAVEAPRTERVRLERELESLLGRRQVAYAAAS